jgi:hypothetical protein
MTIRKFLPVVTLAAAIAYPCTASALPQEPSQASGDSVADAARKAREQKKIAPKAKRVVTEDDIAPRPAMAATPPAAQGETPAPGTADGAATPKTGDVAEAKEDPNSEAAWRKRFAAQHKRIADAQLELDVLQRELQKAGVQYYSDPQKALKEQYSRQEINDKNDKIEAKKKEIAALNQQLSNMEEELRRSGGDPGWSR